MQFDEENSQHLKDWIIKRLENISDADTDVLADYVLALIKSDDPEDQTRANCTENLEDFLQEHTGAFVADIFTALNDKSYLPGYVAPVKLSATAPAFQPPTGPSQPSFQSQGDQSRKRTRNDREGSAAQDNQYGRGSNGDRALKQSRRGGASGPGGRNDYDDYSRQQQSRSQQPMPMMPTPPPGFPQFDPNNPMAAMLAMQQAMGLPMPPGFSGAAGSPAPGLTPSIRERCRDYDTKGYCARGSLCPYEHGTEHIVLPGGSAEYDPKNASLSPRPDFNNNTAGFSSHSNGRPTRGRGRGRGAGGRGDFLSNGGARGGRAAFSSAGPNQDRNITSIVVEQIPEDKFSETSIREFFDEFGTISDVNLQAYKRLAVIKYADYNSAKQAYESPKVIFDNRFVKVYWYKPEAVKPDTAAAVAGEAQAHTEANDQPAPSEDTEMIDPEAFALKQAEAQAAHEAKAAKLKEAEAQKEEIQQKIHAAAEERRKLMEKLAAKTKAKSAPSAPVNTDSGAPATGDAPSDAKQSQTDALRAKLAELEAEAETLGIPAEDPQAQGYPSYRGRGRGAPFARGGAGYRGRGAPAWRGGGGGGWRGGAAAPGGAVARLDNRPRSVELKALDEGVDFGDEKVGEALRVYLFSIGDFTSIKPSTTSSAIPSITSSDPSSSTSTTTTSSTSGSKTYTTITFAARYVAEIFIDKTKRSGSTIAGVGKVELGWVANDVARRAAEAAGTLSTGETNGNAQDVNMGDSGEASAATAPANGSGQGQGQGQATAADVDVDYDVADEDEDRWMR